jgi:hypothetical protein
MHVPLGYSRRDTVNQVMKEGRKEGRKDGIKDLM